METRSMINSGGQAGAAETVLQGHVYALRKFGSLSFLVLRLRESVVQVVCEDSKLVEELLSIAPETAVRLEVTRRLKPGSFHETEYLASSIQILSSPAEAGLPVEIAREKRMESLSLNALLQYRPLTLRNEKIRAIFKIEAEFCRAFREFLGKQSFTEIHSPKLVSTGTEGGASLFSVDYFGQNAYLAQSPQFYKQIMVGVFERVFEIGPVYRAEEHNTARHLNEYLSMDLEMGFIENEQTLMRLQIQLLKHMFSSVKENCPGELSLFAVAVPEFESIPQMKLEEAVEILHSKLAWKGSGQDLDPEGERLLCEYVFNKEGSRFLYLTHYPHSTRPFYAMPEAGTSKSHSFDLLYNGLEITTGGQRIHEYENLLASICARGMQAEMFADYLQCFKYGMPPHGGLAIGLERLTKQFLGLKNVREASLFPRDRTRISP